MKHTSKPAQLFAVAAAGMAIAMSQPAQAMDAAAAEKLARQEGCLRCHGIDRAKDGPAYKQIAEKNRGKADAEGRLIKHLSSGQKVKFEDGHEEEHKVPKTKDPEQIKNLIQWILSL